MTPPLCVFGLAETALVNQAPAKSAPGLGPSGFDPHAFARPGLRAPLAPGQQSLLGFYRTIQGGAGSPGQPGRCNRPRPESAHDSGNHPAVTHRPGKKPPGPWITASLALASDGPRSLGDFCVRWPLHRNAFGDQEGVPLGSADHGKASHPRSPGGSSSSFGSGTPQWPTPVLQADGSVGCP